MRLQYVKVPAEIIALLSGPGPYQDESFSAQLGGKRVEPEVYASAL